MIKPWGIFHEISLRTSAPISQWPAVGCCLEWASNRYVKLRVTHAPGRSGTFPRHWLQRKPLVSNPGMHHGTCVTHVPWCMSGSLNRGGRENVFDILGACATRNFAYLVWDPREKRSEGFAGLFLCLTLNSIQMQCVASVKYAYMKSLLKTSFGHHDNNRNFFCMYVGWYSDYFY